MQGVVLIAPISVIFPPRHSLLRTVYVSPKNFEIRHPCHFLTFMKMSAILGSVAGSESAKRLKHADVECGPPGGGFANGSRYIQRTAPVSVCLDEYPAMLSTLFVAAALLLPNSPTSNCRCRNLGRRFAGPIVRACRRKPACCRSGPREARSW